MDRSPIIPPKHETLQHCCQKSRQFCKSTPRSRVQSLQRSKVPRYQGAVPFLHSDKNGAPTTRPILQGRGKFEFQNTNCVIYVLVILAVGSVALLPRRTVCGMVGSNSARAARTRTHAFHNNGSGSKLRVFILQTRSCLHISVASVFFHNGLSRILS